MILVSGIIFVYLFSNLKAESYLEVGDKCGPSNQGVCTSIMNCPEAVEKLKQRQKPSLETCGFQGRLEIVCCPSNDVQISKIPVRNSVAACERYSKDYPIRLQPFIINGENASLGEFPHMAAVGYPRNDDEIVWECGGTLISERFVLTAAHCNVRLDGKLPSMVRLGKIDLLGDLDNGKIRPNSCTLQRQIGWVSRSLIS
ncbi:Trypsin [Popillia japonica]|uniref:Trypsin n=1 Tax=Popillia japonica TaxID=7064 RepID=A0AAW1KIP8_POPJA